MLQLNKSGTNGSYVALLIGEGDSACPFWILEFGVCVNAGITHTPIQTIHYHGKLHWNSHTEGKVQGIKIVSILSMQCIQESTYTHTCTQGSRNTSYKNCFSWIQWLRAVHYKVTVIEVPGSDLDLSKKKPKQIRWKKLFSLSL